MKIVDVKAYAVAEPVAVPYAWRKGLPGVGGITEWTWLRVMTDEGIDGYSKIFRGAIALDLIRRHVRDRLIGRDPLQKELLWHELWEIDRAEEFPIYFLGAVDVALWDIMAKAAGIPLHQLMGGMGGYRDRIQAYASTVTFGSLAEYLDVADQCLEFGFRAIKLHAWGDARQDAKLCQELRKRVGDEIVLMYDGSSGFNPYEAHYVGKACEDAGYYWYEEPMREFSLASYRRLCADLAIPVLAAETTDSCHYNAADFIVQGAADMIRTSAFYKGGFTGALRIARLADAFQMNAEVHGEDLDSLQLCLAISNTSFFETLISTNPIAPDPIVGRDGYVQAPGGPGVGWQVDPAVLARTATATL